MILWLIILLALDQITKYSAAFFLRERFYVEVIPGVFQFYYLENHGAAFGMMRGKQFFFIAAALFITAVCWYLIVRSPRTGHYRPLCFTCMVLSAGALGNMIDRVIHGYVIDFLYVSLIDFPVFNVADCYVCISVAVLILLLFTKYREDSFDFLSLSRNK